MVLLAVFVWCFLSCLFGSEAAAQPLAQNIPFLSCLFGSEELLAIAAAGVIFLSCLFGSEAV